MTLLSHITVLLFTVLLEAFKPEITAWLRKTTRKHTTRDKQGPSEKDGPLLRSHSK